MPNIYALQGRGNTGKSMTLKALSTTLQTNYPSASVQTIYNGTADIAIIMRGVNGLVVGIESQGDPSSRLQNTLAAFANVNCDIIFCACRTRGMTVNWINALSPRYNIHFIQQNYVATNHPAGNVTTISQLRQQAGI